MRVAWEGLCVNYQPLLVFLQCGDACNLAVPRGAPGTYDYRLVTWDFDSHGLGAAKPGWILPHRSAVAQGRWQSAWWTAVWIAARGPTEEEQLMLPHWDAACPVICPSK